MPPLLLILLFLQTALSLSATVIPVVILLATVGVAYGLKLNGSRTLTVLGAVAAAYAALGPQLSEYTTLPSWLRVTMIVLGIVATTLNERAQGGVSDPTKRAEAGLKD